MDPDYTTTEAVTELMASSKSEQEWNANADRVKRANGGDYPGFWYMDIVVSGVAHTTMSAW